MSRTLLLCILASVAPAALAGPEIRFIGPGDVSSETVLTIKSERPPAAAPRRLRAWPPPQPVWEASTRLNIDAYADAILTASYEHGLDPALIRAVIHAESSFNPEALSPKGAQGLMQLMPATARRFGVEDPFDPAENIDGGARYLSWLLARFDDDMLRAVAAYNAGEGAVDRHGGIPPYKETQTYVERVDHLFQRYRHAAAAPFAFHAQALSPEGP